MKTEAKVVYQKVYFRVWRTEYRSYHLQCRKWGATKTTPAVEWVTIESYDYFSNARARAKRMNAVMLFVEGAS